MKFPTMFSPVQIGSVTVPNRFVVPPMGNNLANTDGSLSFLREFLSCFPLILRAFPAFCLSVIRCADHKKRPFSFSNSLMKRTIYYPK